MAKIITAAQAAALIGDGATLGLSGFCGFGSPEALLEALQERFKKEKSPKGITLIKGVSIGDKGERGASRLGAEGLVDTLIASHIGLEPAISRLVAENKIKAYLLPLGTITALLRAAAGKKPRVITAAGLKTFVDPRLEGSKCSAKTTEDIVSLVQIDGEEYLCYKPVPLDFCILRGTYADTEGNISLEKEALRADQFEMALAAHNSGGIVIAQVERIVEKGSLDARNVAIHGFMVDYIVEAKPEQHYQGFDTEKFRPELTGEIRTPLDTIVPMPLGQRKVCGRRCAMELEKGSLVNLGIGMPDAVAAVAAEEGISEYITLSIESGVLGGVPLAGLGIGATVNPEAIYKMADTFDLYDGGGLDMAFLGLAEMDGKGNVNVSKFNGKVIGPGGFIDITQNAKKVCFMGTFTTGGLKTDFSGGEFRLLQEGAQKKLKKEIEQVTFSAEYAAEHGQEVLYVTERAVFRLTGQGVVLTEIAPGADLERDILAQMEFRPLIAEDLKEMDARIFRAETMGLAGE